MQNDYQNQIMALKEASLLDVPSILEKIELHDEQTAMEMFDQLSQQFETEDLIDNIINPTFLTVIDSLLGSMGSRKLGITAQRLMLECKEFSYGGKLSYLMPDSYAEYDNANSYENDYSRAGTQYVRKNYKNDYAMNRYKKERVKANGGRVNMEDEYLLTNNISASQAESPDGLPSSAETDHIIPLKTVFKQAQDIRLEDNDIKVIANQDDNFALTARRINNPKRDMSNSEFIALQDRLKAENKPYVHLTEEQKENMLKMEREAQKKIKNSIEFTIRNNLLGEGNVSKKELNTEIKKKEEKLGRQLSKEEKKKIEKEIGRKKALRIYKNAAKANLGNASKEAGKQGMQYLIGDSLMLMIKPLYYEIKDSFISGFVGGVNGSGFSDAFSIRFERIRDYVWGHLLQLKTYGKEVLELAKKIISSLLENLMTMFLGIFKKIFRLLKEGVKIISQTFGVLFGPGHKERTSKEKADAIIKIVGTSVVSLIGITVDSFLTGIPQIPDKMKTVISSLFTGVTGIMLFWIIDKADLFNTKDDRRQERIKEIFVERIEEVKHRTDETNNAALEVLIRTNNDIRHELTDLFNAFHSNEEKKIEPHLSTLFEKLIGESAPVYNPSDIWNFK